MLAFIDLLSKTLVVHSYTYNILIVEHVCTIHISTVQRERYFMVSTEATVYEESISRDPWPSIDTKA